MIRYIRRKHVSTTEHGDTVLYVWLNGAAEARRIQGPDLAYCEEVLADWLKQLNRPAALDLHAEELPNGCYKIVSRAMKCERIVAAADLVGELAIIGQQWRQRQEAGL